MAIGQSFGMLRSFARSALERDTEKKLDTSMASLDSLLNDLIETEGCEACVHFDHCPHHGGSKPPGPPQFYTDPNLGE